ncbi:MAG: hypothetical protein KDE22_15225, partial [Rhodobacterales bacterium]|nr:hypothetical protein [Rhodobacterales bacterium]
MAKKSIRRKSTRDADLHALVPPGSPRGAPWDPLNQDNGDQEHRDQSYRRHVRPYNDNQRRLMEATDAHALVVALGPA